MSGARQASALVRRIEELERRLKQHDRRVNNMFREGVVTAVDYETGQAVMDAGGIETPSAPWLSRAGDVRDWNPVSVGERAVFISPSGDPAQGMILPGGFSSRFPQNSKEGGSPRRSIGPYSITESKDGVAFRVGNVVMSFGASGLSLTVGGVAYTFTGDGFSQVSGQQSHDEKNVGSTHTHGGVRRGNERTDEPG